MEPNVYAFRDSSQSLGLCSAFLDSRNVNRAESLRYAGFRRRRSFGVLKQLRRRSSPLVFAIDSASRAEPVAPSTAEKPESLAVEAVSPVYVPTPPNRDLRTPHSGYHFDGSTRKFFEGWYFKVSIPECRQSFCFMYSMENPAFRKKLTRLEEAQHGPRFTGVGAQILGANDKYICQYTEESQNFWGSRHELMLGNTFIAQKGMRPPNNEIPPQEFNRRVLEGFQVTPLWHQGSISDDGRLCGHCKDCTLGVQYPTYFWMGQCWV